MKIFAQITIIVIIILITELSVYSSDKIILARLDIVNRNEDVRKLSIVNPDIVWLGKDLADLYISQDEYDELVSYGLKITILHDDAVSFFRSRLDVDKDMGGYKTLSEINDYVDQLILDYPSFVSNKVTIGSSIEGRDIYAIKISDNPNVDEDEPEILFTSLTHAREVITPEVIFYYLEYMIDNYGTDSLATYLIDNREIWIIPCINPDGYYYNEINSPGGGGNWRKNRRDNGDGTIGVDLNRNFDYKWGYDNVGSSDNGDNIMFRGGAPFSEPETQALRDFIVSREFGLVINYHSYANMVIWPWEYEEIYSEDENMFNAIGDSLVQFNGYNSFPGWNYYVANGTPDDWCYGNTVTKNRIFSFTIEVGGPGDYFWPPLSRIPELTSENLPVNLYLTNICGDFKSLSIPNSPQLVVPDFVDIGNYQVNWTFCDSSNEALNYELANYNGVVIGIDSGSNYDNYISNGFQVSHLQYFTPPLSYYSGTGNLHSSSFQFGNTIHINALTDTLHFMINYDIVNDGDYAYLEASTDGSLFYSVPGNISDYGNAYGNNKGFGFTGSSGGWIEAIFDLTSFLGKEINVRLVYYTNSTAFGNGIYIDNIYPFFLKTDESIIADRITDTFFNIGNMDPGNYQYAINCTDTNTQTGGWSALKNVSYDYADTIYLSAGWNLVSINKLSNNTEILSLLNPIVDNVNIIKSAYGDFCIPNIYCGLNGWNPLEALSIHSDQACTLLVNGIDINPNYPIVLHDGWNSVSYLPNCPIDVAEAVSGISSNLDIVKAANGDFYIPGLTGSFGSMYPGQGYKMHTSKPDKLKYPVCPIAKITEADLNSINHENPYFMEGAKSDYYQAIVVEDSEHLNYGDKIGVFCNDSLVGSGVYNGGLTSIAAWRDDPITDNIDGYIDGTPIEIRTWNVKSGIMNIENADSYNTEIVFDNSPFTFIELNHKRSENSLEFTKFSNYPNPFNSQTTIDFNIEYDSNVELDVYDILGRKIKNLLAERLGSGPHSAIWDGLDDGGVAVSSGVYFLKLSINEQVLSKKMILLK